MHGWQAPRWLPVAAVIATVVWGVSIWLMVAGLDPVSATTTAPTEEIAALQARVDGLTKDVAALQDRVATARTASTPTPAATPNAALARFVTGGDDRYNCSSFQSQAESQEALAANAPGDPNKIDMNGNGVACEDYTYAPGTPRNMTPITNR